MELIWKECQRVFGQNKNTNSRLRKHIYCRACFYHYADEFVTQNRSEIARFLNKNHATVLSSFIKLDGYLLNKDFKEKFLEIGKTLSVLFNKEVNAPLTREQEEIKALKIENAQLEKKINRLEKITKLDVPQEFINFLVELPEDVVDLFIKTRLTPYLLMYKSDKRRKRFKPNLIECQI